MALRAPRDPGKPEGWGARRRGFLPGPNAGFFDHAGTGLMIILLGSAALLAAPLVLLAWAIGRLTAAIAASIRRLTGRG